MSNRKAVKKLLNAVFGYDDDAMMEVHGEIVDGAISDEIDMSAPSGMRDYTDDEEEEIRRWTRWWTENDNGSSSSSSSSSSSGTGWVKRKEPMPDGLTIEDCDTMLETIESYREQIDGNVRAAHPNDPTKQAKEAKKQDDELNKLVRKYQDWRKELEEEEEIELLLRGIRQYDMGTDEGNRAVMGLMDDVLNEIREEQYALKDRVAAKLRERMAVIGEEHEAVWENEVRERIFNDLVVSKLIKPFEPLDF